MAGILEGLTSLPAPLVCAIIFLLAMAETAAFAGLAVPGETAVVLGGVVAFQGRIPVAAMATAASRGAIVGDALRPVPRRERHRRDGVGRRLHAARLPGRQLVAAGRALRRPRID